MTGTGTGTRTIAYYVVRSTAAQAQPVPQVQCGCMVPVRGGDTSRRAERQPHAYDAAEVLRGGLCVSAAALPAIGDSVAVLAG